MPARKEPTSRRGASHRERNRATELEDELREAREDLQSTIEEYETSSEELLSVNRKK